MTKYVDYTLEPNTQLKLKLPEVADINEGEVMNKILFS